jgi:hypothetical protein
MHERRHHHGNRFINQGAKEMTIKPRFIALFLAAGAIAAAAAAAPAASAADGRTCTDGGGASICQSPGNVEVHPAQPRVQAPQIYGPFSSPAPLFFD